jgi:phage-related protein
MANIILTLTGGNGETVTLGDDASTYDYILNTGVAGLAIPPVNVRVDEAIGDGGYYVSSRRLPRDIDLPITILGDSREDVETKFIALAKLLSDRSGATRIMATYPDTSEWYIDGYYISGGNVTYGTSASKYFAKLEIAFRCPNPYWTKNVVIQYVFPTIGSKSIVNSGDINSYPVWTLTGPMANITFTSPTGETWTYLSSIAAGAIVIVDTDSKTVKDPAGVSKYSGLGNTPNLFALPAGTNSVNITGGTFGAGASIEVTFSPRKEVVF